MKMNNILENHPKDARYSNEEEDNLINLNILQDILEESIGSYATQNPQNIYDEDFEQILGQLEFSRGLKNHKIVLGPDRFIRWISAEIPVSLMQEIHNPLMENIVFDAREEN